MEHKISETISVSVPLGEEGVRADVFLARRLSERLTRARVQALIRQKLVSLNGKILEKPSVKVCSNDDFEIKIPPPDEWGVEPEPIAIDIVFENEDFLVVNKPRGLVVHPAAGHHHGTLVNAILAHIPDLSGIGGELRPGIVHRLDKDTTGLLVVAKTERAFRDLQKQIREGKVKRQYLALVKGRLSPRSGVVDAAIGRHPVDRKKMTVVKEGQKGRDAVTEYEVIQYFGLEYSLLMLRLRTGRTHQIRVHMAYLGHPVVGDATYSRTKGEFDLEGQALHAFKLGFFLPGTEDLVEFSAPLPGDFRSAIESLERRYKEVIPNWIESLEKRAFFGSQQKKE